MSLSVYSQRSLGFLLTGVLATFAGCGGGEEPGGPGGPGGGPGPQSEASGPLGDSPTIRQVMVKLTKGPNSLTPVIGKELETDPPAWETIAPQAAEYARLALAMGKNDPPKGSKESWTKLAGEFAASAQALDKSVQAKDRSGALEAHGQLTGSCMTCHREHRRMGPGGRGGPGGPPPGGPGGPGGPPPRSGPAPDGPPLDGPADAPAAKSAPSKSDG